MQTPFLGLRTAIYKVNDIAAATDWYKKILGIEPYFNEPFYVGFNIGGFELGLQPQEDVAQKTDNVMTYWGVEDVEATHAMLLSAGALPHEEPTEVGGGIIVAAVKDPWDNVFGIIYNPNFKM
ncbi:MAG: VOC family protein [Taibaiella sp.]|nr:VOC family protein [Taibaiella sp.]